VAKRSNVWSPSNALWCLVAKHFPFVQGFTAKDFFIEYTEYLQNKPTLLKASPLDQSWDVEGLYSAREQMRHPAHRFRSHCHEKK